MKESLFKLLGVLKLVVPVLYIAGAVFVWFVFSKTNPDGLANLGLVLYTFPIVLIGTFLLHQQFPYVSGGYYEAHALYFWSSVVLLAFVLFLTFHGLQKIVRSNLIQPPTGMC